jgi:hypothetical protein
MIYEDMQYNYMGQVQKNTSKILANMYEKSNKEFADTLYKFLSEKYEWRDWVVVAFNDVSDKRIKLASNAFQITLHGRHVIVSSSTKDRETDIQDVVGWLVVYCFTSRSRIFHLYGDVTNAGEGLQNLGLCSALRAFEQGGIFIVPHLLRHGTSVFPVSSEGPPHFVASYDTQGDVENLFLTGFSRVPY